MVFRSTKRSRRHKNNQNTEKTEQPFFSMSNNTEVQKKEQPFFQTKLTVGQPSDKYEKEADAVADHVVNKNTSSQPAVQEKDISSIQRTTLSSPIEDEKLNTAEGRMEKDKLIQEQSEALAPEEEEQVAQTKEEEEEPDTQMQAEEEEEQAIQEMPATGEMEEEESGAVQTKSGHGNNHASPRVAQNIKKTAGSGRKLPTATKTEMETSIGHDFSQVNIHTGSDAIGMNKELHAQAFTHGQDIYFNSGKYRPETADGKRLLAHELTHVVQQNNKLLKSDKEIQTYRSKKAFNFNTDPADPKKKNTGPLQEEVFNKKKDKEIKPWIKNIYIQFDGVKKDDDNDWMPTGRLIAFYHPNSVMPFDWIPIWPYGIPIPIPKFIGFSITGGKHNEGYTDSGNFTVTRIEGVGYNDMPFTKSDGGDLDKSKGEGPRQKYAKDLNSTMSYAIFFNGGQAIHSGSLETGSHSCVHVDWGGSSDTGNTPDLQQLNYHSVKGLTKVIVSYDPAILPKLCCERHKHRGISKGGGPNPCKKIKAESC